MSHGPVPSRRRELREILDGFCAAISNFAETLEQDAAPERHLTIVQDVCRMERRITNALKYLDEIAAYVAAFEDTSDFVALDRCLCALRGMFDASDPGVLMPAPGDAPGSHVYQFRSRRDDEQWLVPQYQDNVLRALQEFVQVSRQIRESKELGSAREWPRLGGGSMMEVVNTFAVLEGYLALLDEQPDGFVLSEILNALRRLRG